MITGLALVAALEKTGGKTDAETLIPAMEGLAFDSPKGKVQFRAEDHQLLQSMYGFRLNYDTPTPWVAPVLTREFTIDDMKVPVANKR